MAEDTVTDQVALQDIAHDYLATLKPAIREAAQVEVLKFVRWAGPEKDLSVMRAHEISQYAENFPPTVSDAAKRADFVRAFLKWAKDKGVTTENLGMHLRVRKATQVQRQRPDHRRAADLPDAGRATTPSCEEWETLKARRPLIQQDLARAMADKDFRENAPLDAARNEQAHLEARIREIDGTLRRAVVLEHGVDAVHEVSRIGDTVTIKDLRNGQEKSYTLVNTDEMRAGQGRSQSLRPSARRCTSGAPAKKSTSKRRPAPSASASRPSSPAVRSAA